MRSHRKNGEHLDALFSMDRELHGHVSEDHESSSCFERSYFGDEYRRERTICGCDMWILFIALMVCAVACFLMLGTNLFALIVQQNLTLKNNSLRYESWRHPPVEAVLGVYFFNYTNIEEFESGKAKKLKVEEVGPYTYIETLKRVNVTHNINGTITYQDSKTYRFCREMSHGTEFDRVIGPNIPFMGAVAYARTSNFLVRIGILTALRSIGATPFLNLNVGEILWGYSDNLADTITNFLRFKYKMPRMFGIFAAKNGTNQNPMTIHTGEEDLAKTGVIFKDDEKFSLDYWHTKECNRIDGTDGTIYPPGAVKPNNTLYLYVKDICRRIPMTYSTSKVNERGISVLRYHLARNVFDSGSINQENRCFCNHGSNTDCLPSGVFNASPCAFGGPIITSLPHFLYGDPILFKSFDGLSPQTELHESYVEIDQKLGVPISGRSRLQVNVMFRSTARSTLYDDKLILPVSWMDYGMDLPEDLSSKIYNLDLFIDVAEICLSYCFVLGTIIFFGLIIRKMIPRRRTGLLIRNLEISTVEIPLVECQRKT